LSFEAELLLRAFVAPLVVSLVVVGLLARCVLGTSIRPFWKRIIVSHAWWLGAIIALSIDARTMLFDEPWQQAVYTLWFLTLTSCIGRHETKPIVSWLFAGLAVAIFLYASLPGGEGWQDMATTKYVGWLIGGIAWLLNTTLTARERKDILSKGAFVWTLFASQAALAICALSCYGTLGAWALSLAALAISFAILVLNAEIAIVRLVLWQVFAAGSLVALSSLLYGANRGPVMIALFAPAAIGTVDRLSKFFSLSPTQQNWISVSASTATLIAVAILLSVA
jgi:hypothetical protein